MGFSCCLPPISFIFVFMQRLSILGLFLLGGLTTQAQLLKLRKPRTTTPIVEIQANEVKITPTRTDDFRTTPNKVIDILHMDLAVRFDFQQHTCMGKEDLLLTPYFYPTDTIVLDARNMIFNGVDLKTRAGEPIAHLIRYDKRQLRIQFEKAIKPGDTVWLSLQYTAQPDLQEQGGSKAIRDNKGLYFMNTDGKEPYKPMQVWTQGETESNGNWFPFVDKPFEKFTQTLSITVPDTLTTLSNGLLVRTDTLDNGLKTDVWENDLPMSGYLVMMAIGNFKKTADSLWRDKAVDYYLEPNYAPYAMGIFKNTPEMLECFSNKLGVLYPWQKYAQVVVRDFVSGAMENTSATLHGDFVQKNPRELVDGGNDGIIAHEMFHQWFGDLITCESWSHLVMNEGFAAYGEQIWYEHQYGADAGYKQAYQSLEKYLNYVSKNPDGPIVDFNYKDKEDMFSGITYQKGARVLNLLRATLGDEAFFLSLRIFLLEHAFQPVQIDDLRRTCEKVSGLDLRPFFTQWFLRGGHPVVDVRFTYLDSANVLQLLVEQKQSDEVGLYQFPLEFNVKQGGETKVYTFAIHKKQEVFYVRKLNSENPERVNVSVDPRGLLPGEITTHKPTLFLIADARNGNYIEKMRAYKNLATQQQIDTVRQTFLAGLRDPNEDIRSRVMDLISWKDSAWKAEIPAIIPNLILTDRSPAVRAKAIQVSTRSNDERFIALYKKACRDSSYSVAGAALNALLKVRPDDAYTMAHTLENDVRGTLLESVAKVYAAQGGVRDLAFFHENIMRCFKGRRAMMLENYCTLGRRVNNADQDDIMIQTLVQRAKEDDAPQVRELALKQLYSLRTDLLMQAAQTADVNIKNKSNDEAVRIQKIINEIIQSENNKDVLNNLKINGVQ